MTDSFLVSVPATTANIGPGFDCLGAALTRYNRFQFTRSSESSPLEIVVTGAERDHVTTDSSNLAYKAFCECFKHMGQTVPAVHITVELDVPLARGMGSSSTAIVGGILGANALAGSPLDGAALAQLATAIEGHPDNVVPALLGGCRLATVNDQSQGVLCEVPWHSTIVPIVVVPAFEVSTAKARQVLPQQYSRADAIYTMGHLGLLIRALETGNGDWLRTAIGDRIHEPYRKSLIPGYDSVAQAALAAGAYGVTISGAGPTLLALGSEARAGAIAQAMAETWQQHDIEVVDARPLKIDTVGATVVERSQDEG
ncbi:homoserine kinase [Oscillatoria sp. CS-180]|uniref:homoserine kinase n=1 Tax=Oscillatoria sp. CS-180 TaxID=3021720 RepID=UPI00232D2ACE|nr:homoserine kinase [Oscillatoria sp. CS-180]MDB9526340.1 homoserine kinase [Oscillatoria sp. CS-180]